MRVATLASLILAASACGYSEKKFQVNTIPNFCAANADCTGIFDAETCIDTIRTVDRSKCDYDPKSAKECDQFLEEESTCVDNGDIGTFSLAYPKACDLIYSCGPLWEEPYVAVTATE
jgi:hypothetical protein